MLFLKIAFAFISVVCIIAIWCCFALSGRLSEVEEKLEEKNES